MNVALRPFLAVLLGALVITPAPAEPYVFLGMAPMAKIESTVGNGISDDGSAYSVGAGYSFGRRFALEGSYFDSTRINGTAPSRVQGTSRFTTTHRSQTDGFGIAAIGTWPVGASLALLGKVGANYLTHEHGSQTVETSAATGTFIAAQVHPTTRERKWSPGFGGGVELAFDQDVRVRGLLEQINGRGQLDSIRLLSLQALYLF